MPEEPLVTVIIPAYNSAHFLGDALESVLRQHYPIETIVVNDGSTDPIHDTLSAYRSRILLVEQENKGLSAARNAGLRRATGKYLLFLDADDILGDDTVSEQVRAAERVRGIGVPVCRSFFFSEKDGNGNPVRCGEWRRFPEHLDIHLCHFNVAPPLAFLVRRDLALVAGGFDEGLKACEDHDIWLRIQALGHPPFPGADTVVWYRRHSGSMSTNLLQQRLHDLEMHRRIARLLRRGQVGFVDALGTRLLACCAGFLLTATRLEACHAAPILDPLRGLIEQVQDGPMNDTRLYDYFLARCLMLSGSLDEHPAFQQLHSSITAVVKKAGHESWLNIAAPEFARSVVERGEALYKSSLPQGSPSSKPLAGLAQRLKGMRT